MQPRGNPNIVRLTRWSTSIQMPDRKKKEPGAPARWTLYGVDDQGVEGVYIEGLTDEEFQAFGVSDKLAREATRRLFARLLRNPAMRDFVLGINIKAALDAGDKKTARP